MPRHTYMNGVPPGLNDEKKTNNTKSRLAGTFNTVRLRKYFGLSSKKKKVMVPRDAAYYASPAYYHGKPLESLSAATAKGYYDPNLRPGMPVRYPDSWLYTTVTSKTVHAVYTTMNMRGGRAYRPRPAMYPWGDTYVPEGEMPFAEDDNFEANCICRNHSRPGLTWSKRQRPRCTCSNAGCHSVAARSSSHNPNRIEESTMVDPASSRKSSGILGKAWGKSTQAKGKFSTVSSTTRQVPLRKSILECDINAYDLIARYKSGGRTSAPNNNNSQNNNKNNNNNIVGVKAEVNLDDTLSGNVLEQVDDKKPPIQIANRRSKPVEDSSPQPLKTVADEWDDYSDHTEVRICGQRIRVGDSQKSSSTFSSSSSTSSSSSSRLSEQPACILPDSASKLAKYTGQSTLARAASNHVVGANRENSGRSLRDLREQWHSLGETLAQSNVNANNRSPVLNGKSHNRTKWHSEDQVPRRLPTPSIDYEDNDKSFEERNGEKGNSIVGNGNSVIIKIDPSPSWLRHNQNHADLYEQQKALLSREVLYEEEEEEDDDDDDDEDEDDDMSSCGVLALSSRSTPNLPLAVQNSVGRYAGSIVINNSSVSVCSSDLCVKPILKKPSSLDTSSETDSDLYNNSEGTSGEVQQQRPKRKHVHFKSCSETNLLGLSEVIVVDHIDVEHINDIPAKPVHESQCPISEDGYLQPRCRRPVPNPTPSEPIYMNQLPPPIEYKEVKELEPDYDDCASIASAKLRSTKSQPLESEVGHPDRLPSMSSERVQSSEWDASRCAGVQRSQSDRPASCESTVVPQSAQLRSTPVRSHSFQSGGGASEKKDAASATVAAAKPEREAISVGQKSLDDAAATVTTSEKTHEAAARQLDWLLREKGTSNILPKSIRDILRSDDNLYDDTASSNDVAKSEWEARRVTDARQFDASTTSTPTTTFGKRSLRKVVSDAAKQTIQTTQSSSALLQQPQTGSVDRCLKWQSRQRFSAEMVSSSPEDESGNSYNNNNNKASPVAKRDSSWRRSGTSDLWDSFEKTQEKPNAVTQSSLEFITNLHNQKFLIPRPPLVKGKRGVREDAGHSSEEDCASVSIYEQIAEPIYEELPDNPHAHSALALAPLPPLPAASLLDVGSGSSTAQQPRRSIFEGASRNEILSILEDAKVRGVESMEVGPLVVSEVDVVVNEGVPVVVTTTDLDTSSQILTSQRHHRIRVSNISNLSDSSHSSEDSGRLNDDGPQTKDRCSSVEVERNDSGVGPETSKPTRLRRHPQAGNEELVCEDCDQPVENKAESTSLFDPLVCKKCGKKRAERREIITEIVETEIKYGRDLRIIRDEFSRPIAVAGLLTSEQLASIFINIDELIEANTKFTEKLRDALDIAAENGDDDYQTVNIGRLFMEATPMLHAFEAYCVRQGASGVLLTNLEKEKELLRIFLRVSQMENTLLRRMNLNSFLMVPVQRVTKYPLLLNRLFKVTAYHHQDRESLREAQLKIELHLEHINQQAKDISGTKIWRRISHISSTYNKRAPNEQEIGNIKLRKTALEVLEWNSDEVRFVMEGRLLYTQINDNLWNRKNKTLKLIPVFTLLVTLGKPNASYRPDLVESDSQFFPKNTGIREATLLVAKEKNNRFVILRDPLHLQQCVICSDNESEEMFEVQDIANKDIVLFKAEDGKRAQEWLNQLRYHAKDLGSWRRRRNALANIMINGMVRR